MFPLKHTIHHLHRIFAFALSFTTCGVIYATPLDIVDFFPLDVSSQWNYAGTVTETTAELPISLTLEGIVTRQNLPGGTIHGRETTLLLELAAATTSGSGELFEMINSTYYSLNEKEFAAHRSDLIGSENSFIILYDEPLFIMPRFINIGDSFSSSVSYSITGVEIEFGEIFTGQGTESVSATIEGIEFIDTPVGSYESIKVVLVRDFEEVISRDNETGDVVRDFEEVISRDNETGDVVRDFEEVISKDNETGDVVRDFEKVISKDNETGDVVHDFEKMISRDDETGDVVRDFEEVISRDNEIRDVVRDFEKVISKDGETGDVVRDFEEVISRDGETGDIQGQVFTNVGSITQIFWLARNIGPVKTSFEESVKTSGEPFKSISYDIVLTGSNRSLEPQPVLLEYIPPIIDERPSFIDKIIEVEGWGSNDFNQQKIPQRVTKDDSSELIAVSAGLDHNLALTADGTVVGWGKADEGQIDVPENLTEVIAIAAGHNHSLAVKSDGTVVGWGNNKFGQTQLPDGLSDVSAVSAGSTHSIALLSDGTVTGWGNNTDGQASSPPGNPSDIIAIDAGGFHNLALKSDRTVIAWGRNNFGQTDVPVGLSGVDEISAGGNHSLALTEDNQIAAWGDNQFNQLEFGNIGLIAASSFKTKGQLSLAFNASAVTSIAAGLNHSLAVDDEGLVEGWGDNSSGQLNIPSAVTNVSLLAAGGNHNVAIVQVGLVLSGSGDVVGEDIMHPSGNVFDQVLLTGESINLRAKANQITRVSFLDENEDIVQVEFSGSGSFSINLNPNTFLPPALPTKYNQEVQYVAGRPSVLIDGADSNTFFSIFTVGSINAVNQALFPEGEVYNAEANVTLVEIINSTGMGGMQLSNATFSATTGRTGVVAEGVPIAVRMTLGDIDASGDAQPYLLFGEGSFTVQAPNTGLRITGGDLSQNNGNAIIVAPNGSTTPGFDTLISQNNFKSDGTPQPTQSIGTTFESADGTNIPVTIEEITIE